MRTEWGLPVRRQIAKHACPVACTAGPLDECLVILDIAVDGFKEKTASALIELLFEGGWAMLDLKHSHLAVSIVDALDRTLPAPGGKRLRNLEYFGLPMLLALAERVTLPDMVLRYSPFDEAGAGSSEENAAAPGFGYCAALHQVRQYAMVQCCSLEDQMPSCIYCPNMMVPSLHGLENAFGHLPSVNDR